jgi:pyrrolidone-carboxylate peptidase
VRFRGLFLAAGLLSACSDNVETDDTDVVIRTQTEEEWAQYVANFEFASAYQPTCFADPYSDRPRVIVTGFGRFLENTENATGRMVSHLVPGLEYPETTRPPAGEVDDPAAQTRVIQSTIELPDGPVDVCGMVLPVFWDVAAILVLKEIEAFQPNFVLMNGIAGSRQPLWIELGSVNEAVALPDGSGTLAPVESGSKLIPEAPDEDRARGLLLSWTDVRTRVEARLALLSPERDENGVAFGELLQGVRFAGFPRSSNTYLCNNTTYAVNYLLDHPGQTYRLLEPSDPREGGPVGLDIGLTTDLSSSPRVFVHWASTISGEHLDRGAEMMREIIAAQLGTAEAPTRGDPAMADADL